MHADEWRLMVASFLFKIHIQFNLQQIDLFVFASCTQFVCVAEKLQNQRNYKRQSNRALLHPCKYVLLCAQSTEMGFDFLFVA